MSEHDTEALIGMMGSSRPLTSDEEHIVAAARADERARVLAEFKALASEWERVATRLAPTSLTAAVRDNCARDLRAVIARCGNG